MLILGKVSCFMVSPLYRPANTMIMVRSQIANLFLSEKLIKLFISYVSAPLGLSVWKTSSIKIYVHSLPVFSLFAA
ncbi:hypothetical protein D3C81_1554770 [compost metagenome]